MAILDNRTALSGFESGDTPSAPDDLSGAVGGTVDTEIFIEGTRSYGYYSGSTRDGLLYDAGSAQNWANNTFYLWVNCGIAGLLNTKANGGLRVRFCGATVSNYFEVNVAGSDDYPPAQKGGWVMLVVDIEKAKTASDGTGGTPPATSAIRYVGISTQTPTMPRMADNTWLDKVWRLPSSTPGILVEGQNGASPWKFSDIQAASESGAWGTANPAAGGAIAINTPIRFGANNATTHEFADTNAVVLWEDWDVATSFYGLQIVGGSGTQSFSLGVKTGTGDDATGSQGGIIRAKATGQRWYFDADDANIDACNVYGATFGHTSDLQLDNANVSFISTILRDSTSATLTGIGDFLRCQVVAPNTADGVAWGVTDDLGDIVFSSFFFSDGHALELTTPRVAAQASKGNRFNGFGSTGTNDAAIYNNTGGAVAISATDGATVGEHTYRNGAGATTTVTAAISITFTGLVTGTEVRVTEFSGGAAADGIESTAGTTFTASLQAGTAYNWIVIREGYVVKTARNVSYSVSQNVAIDLQVDANFNNS